MNSTRPPGLLDLLGDTRAEIMELLRTGPQAVTALASDLELSDTAVRRHLVTLEQEGLVSSRLVRRDGPGRPGREYRLTDRGRRLYPERSAEFANELLDYLEAQHGRESLRAFLRQRAEQHGQRYAAELDALASADPADRTRRLAELLSEDGFISDVRPVAAPDGATVLQLKQGHCAVAEIAKEHPEICAYEAALFKRLLGTKVSRRQTIAGGAGECICHVTTDETA